MFFDQGSCSVYGQVSYHDFEGIAEEADEAPRILTDLGDKYTMIMRNHGLLTIGRTIAEAIPIWGVWCELVKLRSAYWRQIRRRCRCQRKSVSLQFRN